MKSWVSTATGLPSFYSDTPVRIVSPGGRVLADGTGGVVLLSDALAAPGVPTEYQIDGKPVTLTRVESSRDGALITTMDGRGIAGLIAWNNADPIEWKSSAHVIAERLARWSLTEPLATGKLQCVLVDPTVEDEVWRILKRRAFLVVGASSRTPGIPMRVVSVRSVSRSRIGAAGELTFIVSWVEASPHDLARVGSGSAPVVTWGDWEAYRASSGDLADHSVVELAHLIAGMPS